MEKLKLKRLDLKKEVVSSLSSREQRDVQGGWTTFFGECTEGWTMLCCGRLKTYRPETGSDITCGDTCICPNPY